jgi:hypothetical protein
MDIKDLKKLSTEQFALLQTDAQRYYCKCLNAVNIDVAMHKLWGQYRKQNLSDFKTSILFNQQVEKIKQAHNAAIEELLQCTQKCLDWLEQNPPTPEVVEAKLTQQQLKLF